MVTSRVVSRRDMATEMSPDGSSNYQSSPRERSSFGNSPPPILPLPAVENINIVDEDHPSKLDIREVQIDKGANWSRRHGSRIIKKAVPDYEDFNQNSRAANSALSLDISDAATCISKYVLLWH